MKESNHIHTLIEEFNRGFKESLIIKGIKTDDDIVALMAAIKAAPKLHSITVEGQNHFGHSEQDFAGLMADALKSNKNIINCDGPSNDSLNKILENNNLEVEVLRLDLSRDLNDRGKLKEWLKKDYNDPSDYMTKQNAVRAHERWSAVREVFSKPPHNIDDKKLNEMADKLNKACEELHKSGKISSELKFYMRGKVIIEQEGNSFPLGEHIDPNYIREEPGQTR